MSRRREIAGRVLAKWNARGFSLEAVPDLVELWMAGEIDSAEMYRRYLAALQAQAAARHARRGEEAPERSGLTTFGANPDAMPATATAPSEPAG
ncbi:hypothetical protein KX729_28880 [Rhizobium sp. XQZ8]|uniref:hypothetical protein n=1 Tax=Rhizobium populisoli TaxID=2859785 RepID=UPI001CA502F4|nr:hypothetical protein [Rhizobium populisoli]MBW6425439.1 hypothetical protein [Rhizobium populisoli]